MGGIVRGAGKRRIRTITSFTVRSVEIAKDRGLQRGFQDYLGLDVFEIA